MSPARCRSEADTSADRDVAPDRIVQQRIDDALARWVPRLGVVGLYLSNLPTAKEFIRSTLPDIFRDLDYADVGVLFDGRDIKAEVPRSFDLHKNMFSSKIDVRFRRP